LKIEKTVCPSGALAGERIRNRRLVSANGTCNKGLRASKGIRSPGRAGLGPTKRPGPTRIRLKNGAYTNGVKDKKYLK